MNSKLEEITQVLLRAGKVLIFPHVQMDGDSLGSSVALCIALRSAGKEAYILINEEIPLNLGFLNDDYCTNDIDILQTPDVCLAVDCSDLTRIESREDTFFRGEVTVCIDHHITSVPFAKVHLVNPKAAATGEIVYHLLRKMGIRMNAQIAEALFAAIATDTGNFLYSNTSQDTHYIIASLYETGMDHNKVAVEIYQKSRPEKVRLVTRVLSTMEFFANGMGNIAYISQDDLRETGATMDESEGIVEQMRNINGVEISAILKEENGRIKVGMRSKTKGDVASIAASFGGGGHKKAAGFTIEATLDQAKAKLVDAIETHLIALER